MLWEDPLNVAVDAWAVGVMIYIMLLGKFPFDADHDWKIREDIKNGNFDRCPQFQRLSSAGLSTNFFILQISNSLHFSTAQSMIRHFLEIDVTTRMTIDEGLSHRWILRHCEDLIKADLKEEAEAAKKKVRLNFLDFFDSQFLLFFPACKKN